MKEISGINHVGIRVADLDRSISFYGKLGFEVVGPIGIESISNMAHPSGICINFIPNADSGITNNILLDSVDRPSGYTHVAFDVNDIVSAEEKILELGIPITEGPVTLPGGDIMFFIRDPDSNVIEFYQNSSN
jgi:lactoylglutathione lyase